jgi:hypothetical protein
VLSFVCFLYQYLISEGLQVNVYKHCKPTVVVLASIHWCCYGKVYSAFVIIDGTLCLVGSILSLLC